MRKNWYLHLAASSILTAIGLMLIIMFLVMAFGGSWYEPNLAIALVEVALSIGVTVLGFIIWLKVIRN